MFFGTEQWSMNRVGEKERQSCENASNELKVEYLYIRLCYWRLIILSKEKQWWVVEPPSSIPFKQSALTWPLPGLFKKNKTMVFRRKPFKGTQGKLCTNWPGLLPSGAHGLLWGLGIDSCGAGYNLLWDLLMRLWESAKLTRRCLREGPKENGMIRMDPGRTSISPILLLKSYF